jgi:hypothetical protein
MIICRSNVYLAAAIRLPNLAFSVSFTVTLIAAAISAPAPGAQLLGGPDFV